MLRNPGLAVIVALTAGWISVSAQAQGPEGNAKPVVTSRSLALTGTATVPSGNLCVPSGETVNLTGKVHVVTIVRANSVNVHVNLADVTGTGTVSGDTYLGLGAHNFQNVKVSSMQVALQHDFRMQSTVGCDSEPLPITVTLVFANDGRPTPASTATAP